MKSTIRAEFKFEIKIKKRRRKLSWASTLNSAHHLFLLRAWWPKPRSLIAATSGNVSVQLIGGPSPPVSVATSEPHLILNNIVTTRLCRTPCFVPHRPLRGAGLQRCQTPPPSRPLGGRDFSLRSAVVKEKSRWLGWRDDF
jgi:hypothetical protein